MPPEGREGECQALLVTVWLNESMCLLRLAEEPDAHQRTFEHHSEISALRRVEER